jgi:hypothetical protein
MNFERLQKIMGAGGLESAPAPGPANNTQQGRERPLIHTDQYTQKGFQRLHEEDTSLRRQGPPLRLEFAKASRTSPVSTDDHQPQTRLDPEPIHPDEFPQPAPNTISINSTTHLSGGDETDPRVSSE